MKSVWNFIWLHVMKLFNKPYMIRVWNLYEISYDIFSWNFIQIHICFMYEFSYFFIIRTKKHGPYMKMIHFFIRDETGFRTFFIDKRKKFFSWYLQNSFLASSHTTAYDAATFRNMISDRFPKCCLEAPSLSVGPPQLTKNGDISVVIWP